MISFWILWVFNALMALIPVYFFFDGLADGSVDSSNMGLWLVILLVVGLLIGGTYWLKTKGQVLAAKILLMITTIPCLLVILYFAIAIFGDVRWN
jgi:hypothetical protein